MNTSIAHTEIKNKYNCLERYKQPEFSMVEFSNTSSYPETMMIEFPDTSTAISTMSSSVWKNTNIANLAASIPYRNECSFAFDTWLSSNFSGYIVSFILRSILL